MSENEEKAIEIVKEITYIRGIRQDVEGHEEDLDALEEVLKLIEKQQEEIDTYKETENDYEHELARKDEEIEELKKDKKALVDNYNKVLGSFISKDKIKELKEKVENEQISNPYDFSYMINELLEE